jgi:hypothetical protein
MKKFVLFISLLTATVCFAGTRDWKDAIVIDSKETRVSGPLVNDSTIIRYTIESYDTVYVLEYSFHPTSTASSPNQHGKNSEPNMAVNVPTKIAVEGRHAYVLDSTGAEVKMHVVKKMKK